MWCAKGVQLQSLSKKIAPPKTEWYGHEVQALKQHVMVSVEGEITLGTRFGNEISYFEPGPQEYNWDIFTGPSRIKIKLFAQHSCNLKWCIFF
jgi:hypothetical protein